MQKFQVKQHGWLAWMNKYPVNVEFVGYGKAKPGSRYGPARYFRAFTKVKTHHGILPAGIILEECGEEDEALFATRAEAAEVCLKEMLRQIVRKQQELDELENAQESA